MQGIGHRSMANSFGSQVPAAPATSRRWRSVLLCCWNIPSGGCRRRVSYVTSPGNGDGAGWRERDGLPRGGPSAVITTKAVLRFGEDGEARLASVHPGVTDRGRRGEHRMEVARPGQRGGDAFAERGGVAGHSRVRQRRVLDEVKEGWSWPVPNATSSLQEADGLDAGAGGAHHPGEPAGERD